MVSACYLCVTIFSMQSQRPKQAPPECWLDANGQTLACTEKVKVLEENWDEVKSLLQDVFDDAILMGATLTQLQTEYQRLVREIVPNYREQVPKTKAEKVR